MTKTYVPSVLYRSIDHISLYFLSKHSPVNKNDVSCKRNATKSSYVAGWTVAL